LDRGRGRKKFGSRFYQLEAGVPLYHSTPSSRHRSAHSIFTKILMQFLDWLVLISTLALIVGYGSWKTRKNKSIESYLLGDKSLKWGAIGLSVMATQASAITFLSTPGQAFESGMGFIQIYFGLPIAIVIICAFILPIYYRLRVYTAYEYLEQRFDLNTRLLAAFLFLVQRGLAAGITIYAPAIILSTVLGWNLNLMNIAVGVLVIVYTVSGGTKAVTMTQKWQMLVILVGMVAAFGIMLSMIPLSFGQSLDVAGMLGKMEAVDLSFDINNRYTIWSGLAGGLFLSLSYFGTDQSQVQRYLGGSSLKESRLGLLFNAWMKIPMQFFILLTGVMLFVFYQFHDQPIFFNEPARQIVVESAEGERFQNLENEFNAVHKSKEALLFNYSETGEGSEKILALNAEEMDLRNRAKEVIKAADPVLETKDADYVFISFILRYLPVGIVGLLLAVILSAAMSSTAGELNALASTTTIDFYKRVFHPNATEAHYVMASRLFTVMWGLLAIGFALSASLLDNLIQAVNILGSLFYGSILGIFVAAFFIKSIGARAVFLGGIVSQSFVIFLYLTSDIGFLWFNFIGCGMVLLTSAIIQGLSSQLKSS